MGQWIVNQTLKPQHQCGKPHVTSAPVGSVWRCPCNVTWAIVEGPSWRRLSIGEAMFATLAARMAESRTETVRRLAADAAPRGEASDAP